MSSRLVVLATDRASYGALSRLISKARRASRKGRYALARGDLEDALAGCLIIWLPRADKAALQRQEQDGRWLRERFAGTLVDWRGTPDRRPRCAALGTARSAGHDARAAVRGRGRCAYASAQPSCPAGCADGDSYRAAAAGRRLRPVSERRALLAAPGQRLRELYPEPLLAQTLVIAERCSFKLDELRYEYPEEIVPAGETPASHLRALTMRGCAYRWPEGRRLPCARTSNMNCA